MTLPHPYAPVGVTDIEMAFPFPDVRHLMPAKTEIPDEFWHQNEWTRIVASWFYRGLPATVEFHLHDGIDGPTMVRHIQCVFGSYQPKHEYKMAATAYLLSVWCEKVEGWKPPTA